MTEKIQCWNCGAVWYADAVEPHATCLSCGGRLEESLDPVGIWEVEGDDFVLRTFNDATMVFTSGRGPELVGRRASELYWNQPAVLAAFREAAAKGGAKYHGQATMVSTGRTVRVRLSFRRGTGNLIVVTGHPERDLPPLPPLLPLLLA